LLPWVVSISIVGWLLWPYRVPEQRALLSNAFAQADRWVIAVSFAGAVVIWLTDAYATARTLQRWGTAISLGETCLIRGATLLFDAINPTLGQAVLTLVVYRRGTSLAQAILLVMLMNVIFIVHIAVISGAGLLAGAAPEAGLTTWLVGIALGSTAIYLAIVAMRPASLARNPTLRWLMDAGISGHAWAFLYRLPNMVVLIVAQVFVMRCFNIDVPWGVSLLYLPALFFIVGMPISVQGLGPGQVASVSFFSAYTPGDAATAEATILACGFAGAALTTLNAIVIGLCCLTTRTGRDSVAAVRSARRR
ncbi:MAG TPA: lysylphosphatidylglycerol synthase domain-containing protein, partial [Polyangiales bacterium]|nr:lysylphosphatidylglycerol synthase domain-containing protein [Polyangiales bacterium]